MQLDIPTPLLSQLHLQHNPPAPLPILLDMLSLALSVLSAAGIAAASPIALDLETRNNGGSNFVSPSFLNLTYSSPYNASVLSSLPPYQCK